MTGEYGQAWTVPVTHARVMQAVDRSQRRSAALVVGVTELAAASAPPTEARALGELFFSKNMARAEVVSSSSGVVHDYRIDQGKVVSVPKARSSCWNETARASSFPLAPTAQILLNGRFRRSRPSAAPQRDHHP